MKLIYAIRATLFYAVYAPLIVLFSALGLTIGLVMPQKQRQDMITIANALVLSWFNLVCGVKLVVEGRENIPPRPFVALSKHQSSWETYFLQRILRPVSTIVKKELLSIPFFGWGLAVMHPIAINRRNPREALRQVMEQGKRRLEEGNNVIIYPEGTRLDPGETRTYGRSGAALAVAAGVSIVPIALNAGKCWPARRFLKYPGTIKVVIGAPIDTRGRDSRELTEEVQRWIESQQAAMP